MAVLNTHGRFTVPALSPLMFTLATVLSLLFFHGRLGILAMGVGVFVGGILQLACQLPALRAGRATGSGRASSSANPDFRKTARLWMPYLASASIVTINQFFAQFFASGLEDGSVSAITNSVMFLQIPIGIFTTSVATVTFPAMSRQVAEGKKDALRGTVAYGIQFLLVLLVPSAILLSVLGREIIAAALQRGHFTSTNTLMAARTLTGYAIGLVSMGIYTFLQKLFNSYKTFLVPLASAGLIAAARHHPVPDSERDAAAGERSGLRELHRLHRGHDLPGRSCARAPGRDRGPLDPGDARQGCGGLSADDRPAGGVPAVETGSLGARRIPSRHRPDRRGGSCLRGPDRRHVRPVRVPFLTDLLRRRRTE